MCGGLTLMWNRGLPRELGEAAAAAAEARFQAFWMYIHHGTNHIISIR